MGHAAGARTNLGLGTIATQVANSVAITGGTIADTTITGGTINNAVVGGTTAAAGSFTTLGATGDLTIADKIVHAEDTNTAVRFPAADTVTVETSGAERLRVDSSGNVGIGTTTPATPLQVNGTASATTTLVGDGVQLTPSISFTNDTDTGFYRLGTNRIGVSTGNDLIANFQSTGDGVLNMGDHAARTNIRTSSTGSHTPRIQVEGTGSGSSASIIRNSTSQNAPAYFSLGRSKGAVDGDNTILANGDVVGTFQFVGADGTNLSIGALIRGAVDGTPALDSVPMELSFRTLAQGDTTVTERMLLTSNGRLRLFNTGVLAIADDDGTLTTGTYTPTPLGGNFKRLINGGAFTLAAPTASEDYTLTIQITNNATAGAITLSGFSKTGGDSFTTTDGHDFFVFVTKCNGFTSATVQALQ